MRFFSVKNYDQFQHYKDRAPPWIKLYNSTLDDYDFTCLPDASRSHLVAIWLLASRTSNRIPYDAAWVGQAIKASTPVDLEILEQAGFIVVEQDASEGGARRKRGASKPLDQSRERAEGETEREQSRADSRDDTAAAVAMFNSMASEIGLPVCQVMSPARTIKLRQRLEECGGLAGWEAALAKVRDSTFLRGGKTDFRCDFDFLMQAKSFTKLMEGSYDDRPKPPQPDKPATGFAQLIASGDV